MAWFWWWMKWWVTDPTGPLHDIFIYEGIKMSNYRRVRIEGGCYFFTVALANRQSH
jgi:hypothetical protein